MHPKSYRALRFRPVTWARLAALTAALCGGLNGCGDDTSSADDDNGGTSGGPDTVSTTASPTTGSTSTTQGSSTDAPPEDDGADETGDPPPPLPTSPKASLRFKGPIRLETDLSNVLSLPREEVCIEPGGQACASDVHRVTLGGADPYGLGIYAQGGDLSAAATIAVDRVVLAACAARIDRDLAGDPVLFDVDLDGVDLDIPGDAGTSAFVDGLYTRGLLRHASDEEHANLEQLYVDIARTNSERPARDWGVASCFAVLTTLEFLFY